ncbi:hypothetical protein [Thalassorhabdomicrobium marinisediminis]|uniref:Mobilization protein n=1 Tax=Thalassorhabdomicrobium marinisediminis TaxID=2170577 RepID=A0A2T7FT62_9RHOB|nr:hypothetical protein [Thalassorhabdomicrobium marinisediminis]PVA05346.1 hypothetical protein DC363_15100 [Thalassorhabdomicrobium marinisediminis]
MKDIDTRISQAQARLNDLKSIARKQERRDDTRRKIIYGAAFLNIVKYLQVERGKSDEQRMKDAKRATHMLKTLNDQVTRKSDREFLGLIIDAPSLEQGD